MNLQVLSECRDQRISPKEAYRQLYDATPVHKHGRAHFVKLRIVIPDNIKATRWLAFLFALPTPLFIARIALRYMKEDKEAPAGLSLSKQDIMRLIATKDIRVDVKTTDGTRVFIKTI